MKIFIFDPKNLKQKKASSTSRRTININKKETIIVTCARKVSNYTSIKKLKPSRVSEDMIQTDTNPS